MDITRSAKSQKLQKHSPEQPEQFDDIMLNTTKNIVKVQNTPKKQTSPHKMHHSNVQTPKVNLIEQKSLFNEEVRIKGQAKLLYMKQCRNKHLQTEQILQNYPFSKMEAFSFNYSHLRDKNGSVTGSIIENEEGIHLVQEYEQTTKNQKYIKKQQYEQGSSFNGQSLSIFHDGTIFQGNYHDGKFCGLGYELHPNGNTYIGMFRQGTKQGYGTYYWFNNNQIYSGEWHGGLPHGSGIYLSKDKYEGNFSNGLKYGFGQEYFANGDFYIGQYINSVSEGYGEYRWADGSMYRGDFKQGVRHGYGIWQDEKEIYKGGYRMDKKEGFGIYKWKNKQIYKGEFRQDYRQGYGQFFTLNKKEQEKVNYKGCWAKGKKNEQGKANQNQIKQLYMFLDESDRIQEAIRANTKKDEKKRVGHKNCIPKQQNLTKSNYNCCNHSHHKRK